jgi:hypothetical protein
MVSNGNSSCGADSNRYRSIIHNPSTPLAFSLPTGLKGKWFRYNKDSSV